MNIGERTVGDQFARDLPTRTDPAYRSSHSMMGGRGVTSVSPTASWWLTENIQLTIIRGKGLIQTPFIAVRVSTKNNFFLIN